MDYYKESLRIHKEKKGKLEVKSKLPVKNKDDLSIAYTPGVAEPCRVIAKNSNAVYDYTMKGNTVAVISDGSAVLGLGNIGAKAAMPVMEGKALLFKEFARVDSFPICIESQDTEVIIETIKQISTGFGGINLEDISSPRCFEIENRLKKELDIPVFHDDQHGTAIVVVGGLINALKLADKWFDNVKIVVNGAGAAAIAVSKFILRQEPKDLIICDSKGIISKDRDNLNLVKQEMTQITNKENISGSLSVALKSADIFIGLSVAGALKPEDMKEMNDKPIIFAMANPEPEIMPDVAKEAGAFIIATGRSDFPNQVNNVLGFPGIFRGALDCRASDINEDMKLAASHALAKSIGYDLTVDNILPSPLDKSVAQKVAKAVKEAAIRTGINRI
ncbi:NAD-dependent malic enzyme [archaeon]|jgi:malate dehydrogenase (oxaloacetate-decarboxylating)|nr:NAD-dependent malic enzyme [archaeon]MBT7393121.1 NAD-dependent malic enzyme [archaeon]